jgi:hypothetical protein
MDMFFSKPSGLQYVSRDGAGSADFYAGSFTNDSTWRLLTLPAFVPLNAKLVQFSIAWTNDASGTGGHFRKPGISGDAATHSFNTYVLSELHYKTMIMECVNGTISYNFDTTSWASFSFTVLGWFI